MGNVDKAKQTANKMAREARPWLTRLGQAGYIAKGIVYIGLGVLALRAAMGLGSSKVDQKTLLLEIFRQPWGIALLAIIALGLICYVLWRLAQFMINPSRVDSDAAGWVERIGYLTSAVGYAAIAAIAVQLITRASAGSGSNSPKGLAANLMTQPFGRWLIILAGLVVIGVGIIQFYQAFSKRFMKEIKSGKLFRDKQDWLINAARYGLVARGIVYSLIGLFLVQAGITYQPSRAGGISEALQALGAFGPWLLGIVALGLIAYGVYAFLFARYGRFYR